MSSLISSLKFGFLLLPLLNFGATALATDLKEGDTAPPFELKNQSQQNFNLASRKGHWTVLFFFPKAETPGCTKQVCAFRDSIQRIRSQDAEVYGISVNTESDQAKFHAKQKLKFDLLADSEGKVVALYGGKMPVLNMAHRWTYILDPQLKIRWLNKNVDPVKDGEQVFLKLVELRGADTKPLQ